jgi:hypothetical protein
MARMIRARPKAPPALGFFAPRARDNVRDLAPRTERTVPDATAYLTLLGERARDDRPRLDAELDAALAALDRELEALAGELKVEYVGPGVGMADMDAEHVYRLVVRRHRWDVFTEGWSLKVCDGLENCDLRPMWPIQGTARLRKRQVVQALPEFLRGYATAIAEAGKAETPAGRRVGELVQALGG